VAVLNDDSAGLGRLVTFDLRAASAWRCSGGRRKRPERAGAVHRCPHPEDALKRGKPPHIQKIKLQKHY